MRTRSRAIRIRRRGRRRESHSPKSIAIALSGAFPEEEEVIGIMTSLGHDGKVALAKTDSDDISEGSEPIIVVVKAPLRGLWWESDIIRCIFSQGGKSDARCEAFLAQKSTRISIS